MKVRASKRTGGAGGGGGGGGGSEDKKEEEVRLSADLLRAALALWLGAVPFDASSKVAHYPDFTIYFRLVFLFSFFIFSLLTFLFGLHVTLQLSYMMLK